MQMNITGHHLEVTAPLKEYVETKFERIQRHHDQITNTHVILTVEKKYGDLHTRYDFRCLRCNMLCICRFTI